MYQWLEKCLDEQYQLVKAVKNIEDKKILIMRHRTLNKKIVVKFLNNDMSVYTYLRQIKHQNLPEIYEVAESGQKGLVLEEYIEGMTISDVLQSGLYHSKGIRPVVGQICEAVSCLHSMGIIHRDIKPENIMITNKGVVKLIDCDAARFYKKDSQMDTNNLGTIGYAAPEQYGISQSGFRSDIYALGVLINVMLTGEHPSRQFCSGKYHRVVRKCTQINPVDRYPTVEQLMKHL